jgi:C4-type Zn-finger protein
METLIIESEGAVLEQIKAYLKELKVNFKTKKNPTVNKELVKLIQEAREQKEKGELITIDPMNIWESIR